MYITDAGRSSDSAAINFGSVSGSANLNVSHYSVILDDGIAAAGNRGETVLVTNALSPSREFAPNDPIEMPVGSFDIDFLAGAVPDATMKEAWDIYLAAKTGNVVIRLGTAAMSATGKANEVTNAGYNRVTMDLATGLGTAPTN